MVISSIFHLYCVIILCCRHRDLPWLWTVSSVEMSFRVRGHLVFTPRYISYFNFIMGVIFCIFKYNVQGVIFHWSHLEKFEIFKYVLLSYSERCMFDRF